MCSDELYKFSDGTLTYVRSVLHDIASNLRMDYLPKRRWNTGVSTAQRLQRKYAKCLLLLVHNCSAEVNVASENMLEVTTASEYQVNAAS
ncbi:hypothetical protein Tco_0373624 [Tanacetum coccineum]